MVNTFNYLLFHIIKRTYLEGSLLFKLVKIFNIYKVAFSYCFNFTSGAFLSQINLLVLLKKEHGALPLFTSFDSRIDCQ